MPFGGSGSLVERPEQHAVFVYDGNSEAGFSPTNLARRLAYVETYAKRGGAAWNAPGGGNAWQTMTFREMYSYSTAGLMEKKRLKLSGRYSPAYPVATDFLESSYTFDGEGRMTGQTYPAAHGLLDPTETAGASYTYGFDSMGRPNNMPGWIDGVTYNAAGQPTAISTTNPLVNGETRAYNVLGQMTSLTTGSYRFEYDFNATANDGRINAQRTFVSNSQIESITYAYDSLNRLSVANGGGSWRADYGYDGFGNLQTVTPTGAGPSAMNVTVNPATNRLNGWTYDANGNVTAQSGFTGTYEVENRLLEASKNSTMLYGYGADNRRIWESKRAQVFSNGDTIEEYLTYWSGQRIGKYKVRWNGTINSGPPDSFVFARVEENVYFGSKPLRLGTETNIAADRLGSIRRGTAKDYFPYGQENPSTTAGDKEKYGTYKHDAATDLSYADQRYYATGAGRFMTADPYRASAGAEDPGSWNRFLYVAGDPVNYQDPSGLTYCSVQSMNWGPDGNFAQVLCSSNDGLTNRQDQYAIKVIAPADTKGLEKEHSRVLAEAARQFKDLDPSDWELVPTAVAMATEALGKKDCLELFGNARTRQGRWDPATVVKTMFTRGNREYGTVDFEYSGVGYAETRAAGFIFPSLNRNLIQGSRANISFHRNGWNRGDTEYNAATILHELGHVYNFTRGSGGFAIGNLAEGSDALAFDKLIEQKCGLK